MLFSTVKLSHFRAKAHLLFQWFPYNKNAYFSHLPGLPNDGQQRQAVDILRCLVYTAAGIGAGEFIRMIFSTSAGRIVFEAYKKESRLPEDIADANGHKEIATFLRAITKRYMCW